MISGESIGSCWVIWRLLWRVWCQPTAPMSGPSMVAWSGFAGTCRTFYIMGSSMTRYVEFIFPPSNWLNPLENSCMKVVGREKVKPTGLCEFLSIELSPCVWLLVYVCICFSAPPPTPSLSLHAWSAIDTRGMNKPPGQAAQQQEVRSVWFLLIS